MSIDTDRKTFRWTSPRYRLSRSVSGAWQDTGWNTRVLRWGIIENEADPLGETFRLGDLTITLADHDFAIYGSMSNDYITLIGQSFLLEQYMAPAGNPGTKFIGRCTGLTLQDFSLSLSLQTLLQQLKARTFVWSYFGISPSGTTAYNITNIGTLRGGTTFQSGYGNCVITNNSGTLVKEGDILKFLTVNNGSTTDVGQTLANQERIEYTVQQWGTTGAQATLVLDQPVIDANIGDFLYKRKTLTFSGNPGQIIYNMLTGSNIDTPFVAADFDLTEWGAGTRVYQRWNFLGTVNQREVLPVLHEVCQSCMSGITTNRSNQIVWSVHRPRILANLSIDHYHATTNILDGFQWSLQESSMARSVQIIFGETEFNIPIDTAVGVRAYKVPKARNFGGGGYVFWRRTTFYGTAGEPKILQTQWIRTPEEAAVLAGRMMIYTNRGLPTVEIPTTLYGMLAYPLDFIYVTHPVGSMATILMQVTAVSHQLDNLKTSLRAWDMTQVLYKKGYAFWGSNALGAVVSATSLGGFGTLGTVHNINTTQHGTIFRWF